MRRLLLLAGMITLVGCMNTTDPSLSLPNTETDVAGSFALTSANGSSLPLIAQTTPSVQWNLVADTMVIATAGTWTETATYELDSLASTGKSTQTGVTQGTWVISNQQINFTTTGGGSANFAGSLVKGTLTIVFNGGQFLYTKT